MAKTMKRDLSKGIAVMLFSALLTCTGQLCWKISSTKRGFLFVMIGFALYGCGALLMVLALRYGELSILHPMLSAGYVLSIILGAIVLNEPVNMRKVLGIAVIIFGLICLSLPERGKE